MTEELDEPFLAAEDVVLERASAEKLYQGGYLMVNPERWSRIRELVPFQDVVALFVPGHHEVISCPFHGRDSKPSFHLYGRTNDAYCFGCPPGKQYYDHVRFVAAMRGGSMVKALGWLEREFKLPPLADVDMDQYAEDTAEEYVSVTFSDLKHPFILHAAHDVARERDLDLAKEYFAILFGAWPTRAEEKVNPEAGDALSLARVLGLTVVRYLLDLKQNTPTKRTSIA